MPTKAQLDGAYLMAGAATMLQFAAEDRAKPVHSRAALRGIGVRTAEDLVPPHGRTIYRHRGTTPISISDLGSEAAEFRGEAIFGGVIGPQFGHVVSQSIGRLWVAEGLPTDAPILFLNANPGFDQIPGYFADLLPVLGVTNPLVLITQPTRVGSLHIGADLCNLDHSPAADRYFLDWLGRNRPAVPVDPDLRIYVSRSRMGPYAQQYLEEEVLEAALKAEGYQVVYPETLGIGHQIELYQRARQLIFADGSAVHLWSLFATAQQEAAIVLRRPWHRVLRIWFKSFDLAPVRKIDQRVADFTGSGANGRRPAALLDMAAVWADLGAAGFHSGTRKIAGAADWLRGGGSEQFAWDEVSARLLATRPKMTWLEQGAPTGIVSPDTP